MHRLKSLITVITLTSFGLLAACSGGISAELEAVDVPALRTMAGQARIVVRNQMPDALIAQISVVPETGVVTVRLVNSDSTIGADIVIPSPITPIGDWEILLGEYTPFSGIPHSGLDMQAVNSAPADVARAALNQWSGCKLRTLTLAEDDGIAQWWFVFCDIKEGTVSGWMNAQNGEFFASPAPPAFAPPTATP
ncbi:MAG: hypothetical protein O2854_04750 [Chloroflexi bacterium]|nr:hypothetical protein [Chloroflexota bacterium]